jgi:uncharacterized protein YbaA (DUF1428 family)
MVQLNKKFAGIMTKYGTAHLIFQLNNTDAPMEGITNIAKTVSANQDDEVWMDLIFYRDRKHLSMDLVTPRTGFIMGEFSCLEIQAVFPLAR